VDLDSAISWSPPPGWTRVVTIDSHTAGEPFRLVVEGAPEIPGENMVERRRFAMDRLEDLRRLLMWEPRGHADMYGGIVGPPAEPSSDISVLFLHNEGFSTMCGHGIIALTKIVFETGILPWSGSERTIAIDTPAGRVLATALPGEIGVGKVLFRNVASFAAQLDATVMVPDLGQVPYDLAFGGAFYAYVDAPSLDLRLDPSDSARLIAAGRAIKTAIMETNQISHPLDDELGFLYGVIFVGPPHEPSHHSRNVCVFADGEIDRSPTGTGVSGRLAIHRARGQIEIGESLVIESIVGSTFEGHVFDDTGFAGLPAVIPEVAGEAFITGRNEFWMDPADGLGQGFLIR
jgi:proline racemase